MFFLYNAYFMAFLAINDNENVSWLVLATLFQFSLHDFIILALTDDANVVLASVHSDFLAFAVYHFFVRIAFYFFTASQALDIDFDFLASFFLQFFLRHVFLIYRLYEII